jgi:hypothetical protein
MVQHMERYRDHVVRLYFWDGDADIGDIVRLGREWMGDSNCPFNARSYESICELTCGSWQT